jgi:hypothetical protein
MNTERLHAIALALHREMNSTAIVAKLEELCQSLERTVNDNDSAYQERLATSLADVYASLAKNATDEFSPGWRQLLIEMGGEKLFGAGLKASIEEIFHRNQITPAVALRDFRFRQRAADGRKTLKFEKAAAFEVEKVRDDQAVLDCAINLSHGRG